MRNAASLSFWMLTGLTSANEFNADALNIITSPQANTGRLNPNDFLRVGRASNETALVASGSVDIGEVDVSFRNRLSYIFYEGNGGDKGEFEWQELSVDHLIGANAIVNIGKTQLPWDTSTSFQPLGFFQQDPSITDLTDSQGR